MGKGSNRREFNKELERAHKVNHEAAYGPRPPKRPGKTVYVHRNGKLVEKQKAQGWIEIPPIPPNPAQEVWARFVDKLRDKQLTELARVATVTSKGPARL